MEKHAEGIDGEIFQADGRVYLRLYCINLLNPHPNSFELVDGKYRFKGEALKEFEDAQDKLVSLGIIPDPSYAEAIILKRTDAENVTTYSSYLAIAPENIHLERLQNLRKKADRALGSIKLMDSVFDFQGADVMLRPPASPADKLAIVYSGMTPDMFKTFHEMPLLKEMGESVEARIGTYQGLPRGFPAILAPFVVGGVRTQTHGALVIDGEDPILKEKLLKLMVVKSLQLLADENPDAAKVLLEHLESKIEPAGQKQLPGSAKNHPRLGGRKDSPRIADIQSDNLPG